jgi:hypothetical protein
MEPEGSFIPPLIPILSQMHPIHILAPHFPKTHSNSIYLRRGLPNGLFPLGFPTKILHAFLIFPCTLHALLISSSLIIHIIVQYFSQCMTAKWYVSCGSEAHLSKFVVVKYARIFMK